MDRLNALRAKQGTIADQMEALLAKAAAENRDLTDDEKQAFKDFDEDLAKTAEAIKAEERVQKIKADLAKPVNLPGAKAERQPATPRRSVYGPKLKSFKEERFGSRAAAEDAAYQAGMWCRAVIHGDTVAREWWDQNGSEPITRAQNEGTSTAGGYLVPIALSSAIIDLREQYGTARRAITVTQMPSATYDVPKRNSGVTAYFAAEENAFTESSKAWGNVRLQAQALGALVKISQELAQDAVISVADDIASEMAYAMAVKEDAALFNGDGTAAYGNITGIRTKLAAGSGLAASVDAASGHDTFAEYDAPDFEKVIGVLPIYALGMAKWYGSQSGWSNSILRLAAAGGGNTIQTMTSGQIQRAWLGFEYVTDATMPNTAPTTDQSDTVVFLLGDLNAGVAFGERAGISITVLNELYAATRQIGLIGWERIDINVHSLGDGTTAGPIVALVAE